MFATAGYVRGTELCCNLPQILRLRIAYRGRQRYGFSCRSMAARDFGHMATGIERVGDGLGMAAMHVERCGFVTDARTRQ